MTQSLFSPLAGLIQDILLLSAGFLLVSALGMMICLRLGDSLKAIKRRKALKGQMGLRGWNGLGESS